MADDKYIYHYTSLESLACILSNRSIRFTQLIHMNDPTEGFILNNLARYIYSSSWTKNSIESLPLWKMYTSLKGVRIKLSDKLFEAYNFSETSVSSEKNNGKSRIEIFHKDRPGFIHYVDSVSGPFPMKYVNAFTAYPSVYLASRELETIATEKLKHWEFENEFRFLIIPKTESGVNSFDFSHSFGRESSLLNPFLDLPFIDFPLSKNALDSLEVLVGPKFTAGQHVLLEKLLEGLAPHAIVKASDIRVR